MQSDNKAKVLALRSIMNNPKLSKILEDGFNAPIGSTKRTQAKSVVSILTRMGSVGNPSGLDDFKEQAEKIKRAENPYAELYRKAFDGQGGGNPYDLVPKTLRRIPNPDAGINFGYTEPIDGQGGPLTSNPYNQNNQGTSTRFNPGPGMEHIPNPEEIKNYDVVVKDPNSNDLWGKRKEVMIPGFFPAMKQGITSGVKNFFQNQSDINEKTKIAEDYRKNAVTPDELQKWNEYDSYRLGLIKRKVIGQITLDESSGNPKKPSDFGLSQDFNGVRNTSEVAYQRGAAKFKQDYPGYEIKTDPNTGGFKVVKTGNTSTPNLGQPANQHLLNNASASAAEGLKVGETSAPNQPGAVPGKEPTLFPDGTYTYVNNDGSIYRGQQGDGYKDPTAFTSTSASINGPAENSNSDVPNPNLPDNLGTGDTTNGNPWAGTPMEQVWGTLSADMKKNLQTSGSADNFGINLMADRNAIKELFPNTPEDQIPFAAGLQGQVDTLRDRLKEEYNLNELAAEKTGLFKSGTTLKVDLTDYMRERDTYIKSIDTMTESVRNNMKTGLTDPATQANNKSYLDYLSTLKGRQNQRYIDLLNTSITHHDAVMASITDQYNTNYALYQEELASSKQLTSDRYNQMLTGAQNMWTLAQAGPEAARQATSAQLAIDNANEDLMTSQLKNAGVGSETSGDLIKEIGTYEDRFLDAGSASAGIPKGSFRNGVDLYDEAQIILRDGLSPEGIIKTLATGISYSSEASARAMIDKFEADGGDALFAPYGYTGDKSVVAQLKALLDKKLFGSLKAAVTSSLPAVDSASTWLSKLTLADLTADKKAAFKAQFSSTISDTALLDEMWKFYQKSLSDPANVSYQKDKNTRKEILNNYIKQFTQ